jgi:hypothetical protein
MEKVKYTLAEQQQKGSFSLTIITGNSSVLQQRIFDEILKIHHIPITFQAGI